MPSETNSSATNTEEQQFKLLVEIRHRLRYLHVRRFRNCDHVEPRRPTLQGL